MTTTTDSTLSGSIGMRTGTQSSAVDLGIAHGLWLSLVQTVLVCALMAGGYLAWPWLKLAFDKPIQRVVIQGDLQALTRDAVQEAVVIYETDTFLGIDLGKLVQQLDAQPWVANARVRRQWPDTVVIDIVEQKPIAYWGNKWMVNAKGRIFEHQGLYQDQKLPRLWSASAIPAETMSYFQIFQRQLHPVGLGLHAVSQNLQGDWKLTMDNGLQVMLDRADPASNVRYFVSIYQQIVLPGQRQVAVVDMRYRHGAAIRWQQQEPVPPVQPEQNEKQREGKT